MISAQSFCNGPRALATALRAPCRRLTQQEKGQVTGHSKVKSPQLVATLPAVPLAARNAGLRPQGVGLPTR